jgi:hypothetical protein
MCNRLRAVASARRLCQQFRAELRLVWDWGDFWHFFEPFPDVELSAAASGSYDRRLRHQAWEVDPDRTVDVTVERVRLHSDYVFWGSHEAALTLADVMPYFPKLCTRLQAIVDDFSRNHLTDTVGMHIRRTDNLNSVKFSPDAFFFRAAKRIVQQGKRVFLASDHVDTERAMRKLFGDAILTYPRRQQLTQRWPRSFDVTAAEDDLIELFVLSRAEYVYGSYWSSFSGVAIAMNGLRTPSARIERCHEPEFLDHSAILLYDL